MKQNNINLVYNEEYFKNKKKVKLKKIKKIIISIGLAGSILVGGFAGFVAKSTYDYHNADTSSSSVVYVDKDANINNIDSGYISVDTSNEKEAKGILFNSKINITNNDYNNVLDEIENVDLSYDYSKYYDLENSLSEYNSKTSKEGKNNNLITNDKIDYNKLYNSVLKNNKKYLNSNTKDYYTKELSSSEIKKVCDVIMEVIDANSKDYDINNISYLFSKLVIVEKSTTTSFAYVTDPSKSNDFICLVINPTLMDSYSDLAKIKGEEDNVEFNKKVLWHELMHLLQNLSNDFNKENGLESGPFKKFENSDVKVNSTWIRWLLEGSAERKMVDDLSTNPSNYKRTLSYLTTYDLSRIFDDDYEVGDLSKSVYTNNLNEMFNKLNIKSDKDKINFLKMMYSIDITQNKNEDFWQYYEEKNNVKLEDSDKREIIIELRKEAVKDMSSTYYKGLLSSLKSGKINDINTVFYFLRLWEIDSSSHLESTTNECSKTVLDYVKWQNNVENSFFEAISNNTKLSYDEVKDLYDNYSLTSVKNGKTINNYDESIFSNNKNNFIKKSYDGYSVAHFARTNQIYNYLKGATKTK
ncbi:MAG: hypothetical protein MR296_04725 [Tenericutes bacterium]|nr:hypothetical protein [Mycoplasmatota bacterium]